jgi:hypothetical protein
VRPAPRDASALAGQAEPPVGDRAGIGERPGTLQPSGNSTLITQGSGSIQEARPHHGETNNPSSMQGSSAQTSENPKAHGVPPAYYVVVAAFLGCGFHFMRLGKRVPVNRALATLNGVWSRWTRRLPGKTTFLGDLPSTLPDQSPTRVVDVDAP